MAADRSSQNYKTRPQRLPVRIPVTLSNVNMFFDSEIMNLSKGGIFIHSDITLPLGSEIEFQFTLPHSGRLISATGIVVWARRRGKKPVGYLPEHPSGMGVQFKKIAPKDIEMLLDALDALMQNSLI